MTKIRKSRKKLASLSSSDCFESFSPLNLVCTIMVSYKKLIVRENPVLCKINEWSDNHKLISASFYQPPVLMFYHNLNLWTKFLVNRRLFQYYLRKSLKPKSKATLLRLAWSFNPSINFLLTPKWLTCDDTKRPFVFLLIKEDAKMEQAGN